MVSLIGNSEKRIDKAPKLGNGMNEMRELLS
jgi:hypothetical protein